MKSIAQCGKITLIERQRKRKRDQRVNVYLDDRFAFALSELVAARTGLVVGQYLSERDVSALRREDNEQVTFDTALHYLSYRQRSESELRQNLVNKGTASDLIDDIISRLRKIGLVDDNAFAQFWIENRDRFNPRGVRALRSELFRKGVSREVADRAIASGEDEETKARSLAIKKLAQMQNIDSRVSVQRMSSLLIRRGFSFEIAYRVARDCLTRDIFSDTPPDN